MMELFSEFIQNSQVLSGYQKLFFGIAPLFAYAMIGFACLGVVQFFYDMRKIDQGYYSYLFHSIFVHKTSRHHLTVGFLAGAFTVWILS